METAGAQCLLLTGFFEDQMRGRHNIRWYAEIGAGFFTRAATYEESRSKARLLTMIARHFEPWRQRQSRPEPRTARSAVSALAHTALVDVGDADRARPLIAHAVILRRPGRTIS